MPFNRPSLKELVVRILAGIQSRLSQEQMRRADAEVYAREIAGASHELHGHLNFIAAQVIYDTAESEYLDRWATMWLEIPRVAAASAIGNVIVTGNNGVVIPADSVLTSSAGVEYAVITATTIAAGSAIVPVEAVVAGQAGNLAAGATVTLSQTIPGAVSTAAVDAGGLAGGAEREDDASLRDRLIARIQDPPHGGATNDYKTWALEVPGVTRAWVYPQELGPGSVTVRFVRDNDSSPIPDVGEVATVQAYIDERRPVSVKQCVVVAPVATPLNFEIKVIPDSPATRAAVTAELQDLIRREAVPGGTIPRTHFSEAISLAPGETDHILTAPAADVASSTGHITTMGTVTWL